MPGSTVSSMETPLRRNSAASISARMSASRWASSSDCFAAWDSMASTSEAASSGTSPPLQRRKGRLAKVRNPFAPLKGSGRRKGQAFSPIHFASSRATALESVGASTSEHSAKATRSRIGRPMGPSPALMRGQSARPIQPPSGSSNGAAPFWSIQCWEGSPPSSVQAAKARTIQAPRPAQRRAPLISWCGQHSQPSHPGRTSAP